MVILPVPRPEAALFDTPEDFRLPVFFPAVGAFMPPCVGIDFAPPFMLPPPDGKLFCKFWPPLFDGCKLFVSGGIPLSLLIEPSLIPF